MVDHSHHFDGVSFAREVLLPADCVMHDGRARTASPPCTTHPRGDVNTLHSSFRARRANHSMYSHTTASSRGRATAIGLLLCGRLVIMLFSLAAAAGGVSSSASSSEEAEKLLWVHPSSPGSLQTAVDAAMQLERATIHLLPGTHRLTRPLLLDQRHSGTRFVGHGHAIVSGGVIVGQPSSDDDAHNGRKDLTGWKVEPGISAACVGCLGEVWSAATPRGVDSRQFYVNGVRANRTWLPFPAGATKDPQGSTITVPGVALKAFAFNQSAIELVYRGADSAGSQWQESRCPVANISTHSSVDSLGAGAMTRCAADYCPKTVCPSVDGKAINRSSCGVYISPCICTAAAPICVGYVYDHRWGTCMSKRCTHNCTTVSVVQPCAHNGNIKIGGTQALRVPAFLENIKELLGDAIHGHPGDYYLDALHGMVYYVPHMGDTMASVVGELPAVEQLVVGTNVTSLSHHNLEFAYSTWLGPSGKYGFVDVQAGFTLRCEVGDPCSQGSGEGGPREHHETPAALQFRHAKNVTFSNCSFRCVLMCGTPAITPAICL